jgi:hypothetical protein
VAFEIVLSLAPVRFVSGLGGYSNGAVDWLKLQQLNGFKVC